MPPCCSAWRLSATALMRKSAGLKARRKELDQRLVQAVADLTREHETLRDTEGVIARLVEEDTTLKASQDNDGDLRAEAALALQSVASALATAQDVADQAGARLSELTARRGAITRSIDEQRQRIARLERDASETGAKRQALLEPDGQHRRRADTCRCRGSGGCRSGFQ